MSIFSLKSKRVILIGGSFVVLVLLVAIIGVMLTLSRVFQGTSQMQITSTGGVAVGFEVHTGESDNETRTTYLPYRDKDGYVELTATLRMRSDFAEAKSYALVILSDYTQIPLTVAGTVYPMYIVEAEPSTPVEFDFSFSVPNQPGKHRLFLVLFQGGDEYRLDNEFRYGEGLIAVDMSDIVIGEDSAFPEMQYQTAAYVRPDDPDYDIAGVNINRYVDDYRQSWITDTVTAGETLEYYIHIGNESAAGYPYVLLAWLDWQQVQIGDGNTDAFFGYIENDERQIIPAHLVAPLQDGVHELQVLYIQNPFSSALASTSTTTLTFDHSLRTALIVRDAMPTP